MASLELLWHGISGAAAARTGPARCAACFGAPAAAELGWLLPLQVGYDAGLQPTERLRTRAAAASAGGATSGRAKR